MAVVEREQDTREQVPERAVFVASDGRRARRLRRAAFAAAFLACLWVVGLGVGMLGFGSLPGVSVVSEQLDEIAGGPGASRPEPTEQVSPSRRSAPAEPRQMAAMQASQAIGSQSRPQARPVTSRPTPPAQSTPPPAAQTPLNPATRQRGWARQGATAPPGQARKVVPPPPPGTRGQRRGQDLTAPPPVPPGQEKKALLPPPPPSPPPKKA